MKASHWIIAAAALACSLPGPASAGVNDPEVIIYRFTGVRDNGGADNTGVATVFHCTNFSGVLEVLRFVTRGNGNELKSNHTASIDHLATVTAVTHINAAYGQNVNLATTLLNSGSTAIAATSINVTCTAMTIDAANTKPDGVALHGIRFSPVPGSQE